MKEIEDLTSGQAKSRLFELIHKCGFSPLGIETLLGYKSEGKYVSAIRNDNKLVTNSMIYKILNKFGFSEEEFKNLDQDFDEAKIKSTLSKFENDNHGADISKFYETENLTKATIKQLIQDGFFRTRKTTPEILEKFKLLGLTYTSNDLSRDLANIVNQQILNAEKAPKILKDGTLGTKMVNEYWAP